VCSKFSKGIHKVYILETVAELFVSIFPHSVSTLVCYSGHHQKHTSRSQQNRTLLQHEQCSPGE
jgi:hypothetical protein